VTANGTSITLEFPNFILHMGPGLTCYATGEQVYLRAMVIKCLS